MNSFISTVKFWIYISVGTLLTYLHISHEVFSVFSVLIVIDTVAAIIASYIDDKWVTSHRLWTWVLKKCMMIIIPLTIALVAKGAWFDTTYTSWLISTVMTMLVFGEGYSIIGHIYTIKYGKKIPELDVVKLVLEKTLAFIRQEATKKIEK